MIHMLIRRVALAAACVMLTLPAHATVKVLATTADWAALTTELGGDKVDVYRATTALQDVHSVEAEGDTPLAQLFDLILFGDFATLELALQTGVDPGPVAILDEIKARLRS